jgi:hypothetical protein
MPNSLTYFPVSGDYRNVADPSLSGTTTDPQVQIIEGLVTFYPRLPEGFVAYVDDLIIIDPASEAQLITLKKANGGTFTLTYQSETTTPLAWNANVATVQSALEALSTIGTGNVTVNSPVGGSYAVTFEAAMSNDYVDLLVADASTLTSPAAAVNIATQTPGAPAVNAAQTITITATGGTFKLTWAGYTTGPLAYNATPANIQSALTALRSVTGPDIAVIGTAAVEHVVEFVSGLAGVVVPEINAVVGALTGGAVSISLDNQGSPAVNEVQTVTITNAVGGVFTLTFAGQTTTDIAWGSTSLTVQRALEALSTIGTGNVTVTGPTNGVYTVEFKGTLAGTNVAQMTGSASGLIAQAATATVDRSRAGTPQISRDTAVAIPARKGRIWNGQLSTIDVVDTPGVELVANTDILGLLDRDIDDLIYDVQYSSVTYAGDSRKIKNFAFVAPTDATPVCITDPELERLDYQGPR